MNAKRKSGLRNLSFSRNFSFPSPGAICRGFILAALLLLPAACAEQPPAAVPTPQVFDAPAGQISTFTRFFQEGCHFGGAVDIDNNILVAGAPCWGWPPGEGAGTAHVFRRSSEGELRMEATLMASDRDDGFQYDQHFGESVALKGTVIAVGAPGYDDPQAGDNTGAVYIFEHNGRAWVGTGKLTPSHRTPGAKIGRALAFDGEFLAASGSPEAGNVSIFRREASGWREMSPVPVPVSLDGKPYVLLDLYGDTLAISTVTMYPVDERDEPASIKSLRRIGIVTLYERAGDQWKRTFQTDPQEASLYAMYGEDAPFGIPVSLGGEAGAGKASWLAVGKPGFPKSGREVGSVAIYERGERGWKPQSELMLAPGEPVPGALPFFGPDPGAIFFGAFVEFEGNRLAVVSTFANTAYVFERQGPDWVYRFRIIPGVEDGDPDDFQRRTIAMSGNSLLLGSPGEIGGGIIFVFNLPP